MKICAIDGCSRDARSRGLCDTHYRQAIRRGEVDRIRPYRRTERLTWAERLERAAQAFAAAVTEGELLAARARLREVARGYVRSDWEAA